MRMPIYCSSPVRLRSAWQCLSGYRPDRSDKCTRNKNDLQSHREETITAPFTALVELAKRVRANLLGEH